jgi:hypothetical protein
MKIVGKQFVCDQSSVIFVQFSNPIKLEFRGKSSALRKLVYYDGCYQPFHEIIVLRGKAEDQHGI